MFACTRQSAMVRGCAMGTPIFTRTSLRWEPPLPSAQALRAEVELYRSVSEGGERPAEAA